MDRVHYAGHSVVTGTAIAQALLDYAQALAQVNGAATVEIPTVRNDGSTGRSEILVGPSSQLMSDAEESEFDELTNESLVTYLHHEAVNLRAHGMPSGAAAIPEPWPRHVWPDFEL